MEKKPSEQLEDFLEFAKVCQEMYQISFSYVGDEDKRLQDLLHTLEFTDNKYDLHNEALKLWNSRRVRREHKDTAKMYETFAQYFQSQSGQKFLNELRQLLGKQRKAEQYLEGHREYRKRFPPDGR